MLICLRKQFFLLHTLFNMEALAIRLCDVDVDDNENPILGLKDEPIVSFEEAVSHWQRLSMVFCLIGIFGIYQVTTDSDSWVSLEIF